MTSQLDARADRYLGIVEAAANRMNVLIDAMLEPSFRAPVSGDLPGAREMRLRSQLEHSLDFETKLIAKVNAAALLVLLAIALFLLRGVATFATDVGMARAGRSVVRDLRQDVLAKYLRLPSSRFDLEPVPAMVSRLNYDTEQVTQASSEAIKVILTDTLTLLVLLGVMLYHSPRVTLVMLVLAPLIGLISSAVARRYRRINRGIQDGVANMAQIAEQALSAQQEVKIYGAQDSELARYRDLVGRNLLLFTKVPHIDPETMSYAGGTALPGIEYMSLPSTRSYGINLSFKL